MMDRNLYLRADRLNCEPPIFRGCGFTELGMLVGLAVLVWLPLSVIIAALAGRLSMALGMTTLGVLATVWVAAGWLQRIKRGRPFGYYQQRLIVWLHDAGLRQTSLVRYSGDWDLGRRS